MAQQQQNLAHALALKVALGGVFIGAAVAQVGQAIAENAPDPIELISSMSEALKSETYRGTFVHIANGHVESMRLLHFVEGDVMRERMTSLNGEAREVYRNNSLVTCIWPGSRSVIVSKSKPRDLLPKIDPNLSTGDSYTFISEPDDRVAGQDAYVVSVSPTDGLRYGYRFWIDKKTSVMLRSVLLDNEQKSLEQVMFTDISYPDSIDSAELNANADQRGGYSWEEPSDKIISSGEDRVTFSTLPAGYKELSESYDSMPLSESAVSHVMLSDGMASVSVYVEYTMQETEGEAESGLSRMGALNAYARSHKKAFITVVGEVPAETVQIIGNAVKFADDN